MKSFFKWSGAIIFFPFWVAFIAPAINELIEILSKIAFVDYGNPTSVKELKEQFFQKLAILEPIPEIEKLEE